MRVTENDQANERKGERGVAAAMVAVFLVVLIGMAALVVDYGNLWQNRRQMVTATDAGALAAAQVYAEGGNGCSAGASTYYDSNAPAAAAASACAPSFITPSSGFVEVAGSVDVVFGFGRVLGLDDAPIDSSTTASWRQPIQVTGLRPIGLCLAALQEVLGGGPPSYGSEVDIPWNFSEPDKCALEDTNGGGNGNGGGGNGGGGNGGGNNGGGGGGNSTIPGGWGYIDFSGGGGGANELSEMLENGYQGEVDLGTFYEGFSGAINGPVSSGISDLISSGECVGLPIYDVAVGPPNYFRIVDFATVVFTEVDFQGAQASRSFTFKFTECVVQGEGGGGGTDYGPRVIRICNVDQADGSCP